MAISHRHLITMKSVPCSSRKEEKKPLYKPLDRYVWHPLKSLLDSLRQKRSNSTGALSVRWFQQFVYVFQSWDRPLGLWSILHTRILCSQGDSEQLGASSPLAGVIELPLQSAADAARILTTRNGYKLTDGFCPLTTEASLSSEN